MTTYLFIDGGYLRDKFKKCMKRYHGDEIIDPLIPAVSTALGPIHILKTFYYDCVDERQAEQESPDDFAQRAKAQEAFVDSIRDVPGWHFREGRLVGARKQDRGQKRVDVLLAVEMLSHAFNKNMEKAILIAGDDDFTPLVDELLRHGTFVEVLSDHWSRSSHLMHAADAAQSLGYEFYWNLAPKTFRTAHPRPDHAVVLLKEPGQVLKFGLRVRGGSVKIKQVGETFHFCTKEPDGIRSRARARELRVLEEYILERFQGSDFLPADGWQVPRNPTVE